MPRRLRFAFLGLACLLGCASPSRPPKKIPSANAQGVAYVGSPACNECHQDAYAQWRGSDHFFAMQGAEEKFVRGDFDNAEFEQFGVKTRFFKSKGKFFVNTEGADGEPADFEIAYTFGRRPLQQYLIAFPGGRLQCLSVAWDVNEKRWFSLYPDEPVPPGDLLHWTGRYQRWNLMCAECHSTNLRRNYDLESDAYSTAWDEINVGCEACHGPGERHLEWARRRERGDDPDSSYDYGLATRFPGREPRAELEACAPCHSRRHAITSAPREGPALLDDFVYETLREPLYHADGQVLDEVYVYGSFLQTKMHREGVRCSDCHNPHGVGLWSTGNGVCTRCHQTSPPDDFPTLKAKAYDTPRHHFHKPGGEGALCVNCHMAEKTYMQVDPRRDHSFRIPRPDLTVRLGGPNACTLCHRDKPAEWAARAVTKWYGPEPTREPHFGEALAAGRSGAGSAEHDLIRLAMDRDSPAIARATAVEMLRGFGPDAAAAIAGLASDPEPFVRVKAAGGLDRLAPATRLTAAVHLLKDPVRAVRIEAARMFASVPREALTAEQRRSLDRAFDEFVEAQRANADTPEAHLNLGATYASMGENEKAERSYRTALRIEPDFHPARLNLATFLNQTGRNAEAETQLREIITRAPEFGEAHYSLGLLLAEENRLSEAVESLGRTAELMPLRARVRYNYALALQRLERRRQAEAQLREAEKLDPSDPDIVNALMVFYLQMERPADALSYAEKFLALAPSTPGLRALIERLRTETDRYSP